MIIHQKKIVKPYKINLLHASIIWKANLLEGYTLSTAKVYFNLLSSLTFHDLYHQCKTHIWKCNHRQFIYLQDWWAQTSQYAKFILSKWGVYYSNTFNNALAPVGVNMLQFVYQDDFKEVIIQFKYKTLCGTIWKRIKLFL